MSKRFKVGQEVVRVRRGAYAPKDCPATFETVAVVKVGTKWVEVGKADSRFTEQYNGKTGRGTTFRDSEINEIVESREAWEQRQRDKAERRSFRQQVSAWSFLDELDLVPIEDIRAAAKLLGLKLERTK